MNPYATPSPCETASDSKSRTRHFASAALLAFSGFVIGAPGFAYTTSDMNRRMASAHRYATYDPELSLFGISITPTSAQLLTFVATPTMLALAEFLVYRGIRLRRQWNATVDRIS